MIYLLFAALLLLTLLAFVASNRNILAPWVILCSMFSVSTFLAMLNADYWDFTIDPLTAVIILTALISFGVGQLLVTHFTEKRQRDLCGGRTEPCAPGVPHPLRRKTQRDPIERPVWQVLLITFVLFCMLLFYLYKKYQLSITAGNPGGFSMMLQYVREAELHFQTIGKIANLFAVIAQIAAYFFAFVFLYNTIHCGLKARWCALVLPFVIYLPFQIFSAARTGFIRDIVYLIVVGCVLYQQKTRWNYWNTVKIIVLGVIALGAFLLIFRFTGFMKDSGSGVSAFYSISKYMGGSIPCFNDFVLHPREESLYIGNNTLFPIYSILRQLGFNLPQLYAPYDFTDFATMSTNIYTGLRRYIEDYTYAGMYVIMFGLGMLYGGAFNYVKNRPQAKFALMLYATTCYPVFEMSIEDRFFLSVISTNTVYQVCLLAILYYVFIYRQNRLKQPIRRVSFGRRRLQRM